MISESYASLSFLHWAVQPRNATPTADCLSVLRQHLVSVRDAYELGLLSGNEIAVYHAVCRACDALVGTTLEQLRQLDENVPTGLRDRDATEAEDGTCSTVPPALRPAVEIYLLLRDPGCEDDQRWCLERLQTGARRRYLRLEAIVRA